jgi:hypothetical protein
MAHTPTRIWDSRRFQEPVAYRIPPDNRMSCLVFEPFQYRLVARLVYLALQLPPTLRECLRARGSIVVRIVDVLDHRFSRVQNVRPRYVMENSSSSSGQSFSDS